MDTSSGTGERSCHKKAQKAQKELGTQPGFCLANSRSAVSVFVPFVPFCG
jgi:hypothetical protein